MGKRRKNILLALRSGVQLFALEFKKIIIKNRR